MTLFIFVFLSGSLRERVCLPSLCSPSVAFVGCTVVFLGSELVLLECVSPLSLLPLGRLRWMYCGFLELWVGFA